MNMKLWNFLERSQGIKNKSIYVENYHYEQDIDGSEYHFAEINIEDIDSETYEASYLVEEKTRKELIKQCLWLTQEYFPDEPLFIEI